jgi:glycosyltransferase involved in cell wall biosynthesis
MSFTDTGRVAFGRIPGSAPADVGSTVLLVLATSSGGVGRHIAQIATGLAARPGYRVLIAGPADTDRTFGFSRAGTPFEPVDICDRPRPAADRRAVRRLRALAADAEVVHAHGLRAGALAVLAVRGLPARRRPKVVVTLHNALLSRGRVAAVHSLLERIVARRADLILAVSADIGAAIAGRGARDVRAALVPAPPLPAARRSAEEVRRLLGIPADVALLLTVARLTKQKGLAVLVEALEQLTPGGARVTAVVAGSGPLAASLSRDAAQRNVPLRLLGPRDDVADLIAAADLVVVPSLWEGQPLIVQEALSVGAAIVATDSGGMAALVGDGAVLVPTADPGALARAITSLLGDPEAAARLRRRALARSLPSADDALRQVVTVYESVTGRRVVRDAAVDGGPSTAASLTSLPPVI